MTGTSVQCLATFVFCDEYGLYYKYHIYKLYYNKRSTGGSYDPGTPRGNSSGYEYDPGRGWTGVGGTGNKYN